MASATRWCERAADRSAGDHATWFVVDGAAESFVGVVSVHSIDPAQADAEIGYRVTPAARGRGFATEAVLAASAWAFDHLPVVRVELAHAVATRAGYRLEGVLRSSYVYGDGHRHDEHLHARLGTDPVP